MQPWEWSFPTIYHLLGSKFAGAALLQPMVGLRLNVGAELSGTWPQLFDLLQHESQITYVSQACRWTGTGVIAGPLYLQMHTLKVVDNVLFHQDSPPYKVPD